MPPLRVGADPSEADAVALVESVDADDLLGALLAIDGDRPTRADWETRIETWAAQVRERLENASAPIAALRAILGTGGEGFQGDNAEYGDSKRATLAGILEGGLGLPILLSSIWMLVGRRAGLEVDGIGPPGHFVVQIGGRDGPYADPFAGGDPVSQERLHARTARLHHSFAKWDSRWDTAYTVRAIAERMLTNNLVRANQSGDAHLHYRGRRLQLALRPGDWECMLECAQAAGFLGAAGAAHTLFARVVAECPDPALVAEARLLAERVVVPVLN